MNQLVVKSFGSVDAVRKYSGALRAATRGISAGNDRDILKIDDRNGDWTFGQDNTYVERDDLWAVNPLTIKHGYIAFDGGRDVAETKDGDRAEMLFSVTQELPEFDDLPELDIRSKKGRDETKWKFQMAVEMVCVEGPNKGAEVVYKPGSMGGLRAVRMIAEEIARRFDDEDADTHVPVVELDSRSYHNRRYNKEVFNPLMHVIEWAGLDDTKFESGGAREDDTKSRSTGKGTKDEPRGNGRRRGGDNRDDVPSRGDDEDRRSAREARKDERTAKGDKVDSRRSSRDEEAVEDEPKARRGRARDEDGGEDADGRDEPRSRGRATHDDGKTARRGPAPRDREERTTKVEEEPRRRGARDRDEEVAETETSSRRDETSSRGRRGARDRDEDQDDREDAKADDAPRSRRGRDDEDEPRSRDDEGSRGPRGRRAAAGGRR